MNDAGHRQPGSAEPTGPSDRGRPAGSLLPVLMMLGCGLALGVIVASCAGTAGVFALLAVGGVVGFVALHYVLWGAWLAKRIRQSHSAEDEADD